VRFKSDENLPVEAADVLRAAGFDCHTVSQEGLKGAEDHSIFGRICAEDRILITLDLDFADIRTYPSVNTPELLSCD
jgi:predicted nuclease of predicted toxin-antitoxin system